MPAPERDRVAGQRVLIYGINYAPEVAGVGRYTGQIGEHLAALGHQVTVITAPPHYPGWTLLDGHKDRAWTQERIAGATVFRCPLYLHPQMRGLRRMLAPLSFALNSAPVAFREALKRRPNVIIAVEPTLFVAPFAVLAAKLVGAKTVLHVQDLEIDAAFAVGHLEGGGLLPKLAGMFDRAAMRAFDRVITISHRMADKIAEKGVKRDQLVVVRNWVDVEAITPLPPALAYRQELGLKRDDFVALYSGNLGAKQGVGLLIETARRLKDEPDLVIVVAGEGPMRPELVRAAASLPNLRVHGFQPEARMGEFLSVANVHVLPQERSAADLVLPSKLGGMLASGRPVIVTADEGTELASFVGDSCRRTPPGDAKALAQALRAVKAEPPCPETHAERLRIAASISKDVALARFTRAALFLGEERRNEVESASVASAERRRAEDGPRPASRVLELVR